MKSSPTWFQIGLLLLGQGLFGCWILWGMSLLVRRYVTNQTKPLKEEIIMAKENLTQITKDVDDVVAQQRAVVVKLKELGDQVKALQTEIDNQDNDVSPELKELATKLETSIAETAAILNPPPADPPASA
jgi:septal ring factor EnvC (AmiA/AmiB activator)